MADLVGTSALGSNSANSNLSQTSFGNRRACVASGDVTSLKLRTGPTGAGTLHAALYADNAGQLTGATRLSGDITPVTFAANTIISATVSPSVAVTLGTFYWIVWLDVGGALDYTDNAAAGGTTRDTTLQTTLANPAPSTTSSFSNIINSWADGTTSSGTSVMPPSFNPIPFMGR